MKRGRNLRAFQMEASGYTETSVYYSNFRHILLHNILHIRKRENFTSHTVGLLCTGQIWGVFALYFQFTERNKGNTVQDKYGVFFALYFQFTE